MKNALAMDVAQFTLSDILYGIVSVLAICINCAINLHWLYNRLNQIALCCEISLIFQSQF